MSSLFDLHGRRLLYSPISNDRTIIEFDNIEGVYNGVYFYQILSKRGVEQSGKVIVLQ